MVQDDSNVISYQHFLLLMYNFYGQLHKGELVKHGLTESSNHGSDKT